MPKTKIIATLGPSSSTPTIIRKMMLEGLDVVRLNFSHGTSEEHEHRLKVVRLLNEKYRRRIKILIDLEGHRIRVGKLPNKVVELKKRQKIYLTNKPEFSENSIYFDYKGKLSDIKTNNNIFIDDGNIHLMVKKSGDKKILAEVITGGPLKERKGINIPDAKLKFQELSQKDRQSIIWGIQRKVDLIAQSFVTSKSDVLSIKKIIESLGPFENYRPLLIAKIENRDGIKNLDEILEVSDGIMIARGDLGISIPVWEVPFIQKQIIKKCNCARKPVITATQMLESMTEAPFPTRAEVSDVANAILDGTNFVMLSGETAVGRYPVEAVKMMNQIIKFAEKQLII